MSQLHSQTVLLLHDTKDSLQTPDDTHLLSRRSLLFLSGLTFAMLSEKHIMWPIGKVFKTKTCCVFTEMFLSLEV